VHGTSGAASTEAADKDGGFWELTHRVVRLRDHTRSTVHAPPSGGVVIDDGARHASLAPARRATGSVQHRHIKEEDATTTLPPAKRQWWEMEGGVGGPPLQ
jgi:hypothetical protein